MEKKESKAIAKKVDVPTISQHDERSKLEGQPTRKFKEEINILNR